MKSKLFSLFLSLVASVGMLYAECAKIGDLYYNLNASKKTAEVTYQGYWGKNNYPELTAVEIPSSVSKDGITYNVTSIGQDAFNNCTNLKSVIIGNNVTSIGNWAFYNNTCLTSIIVGLGNTTYDSRNNCNAIIKTSTNTLVIGCQSTIIPNSVTSIESNAFNGCSSLTAITIPNSVRSIGGVAFCECSGLKSVTIPNSVTSIGVDAFYDCTGMTSVTINSNAIVSKKYSPTSSLKNVFGTQVTTYILGDSVKSIGECAFYDCSSLTSITLGKNVSNIGLAAFKYCTSLTSVVWNIRNYSDFNSNNNPFYYYNRDENYNNAYSLDLRSQITSFVLGNEVEHIPALLCERMNKLTSVKIPNSVTSVGSAAFYGCTGLTSPLYNAHVFAYMPWSFSGEYTIPNGIESIAGRAFSECSGLTSVTIPNSVTSIGGSAFYLCSSLTSVTFGNGIVSIGACAFMSCWCLTSIIIPSSVIDIKDDAFSDCQGLTSVTIGESVQNIGKGAFYCGRLKTITCYAINPPIIGYGTVVYPYGNGDAFYGVNKETCIVYVPQESVNAYKDAFGWTEFYYNIKPIADMNDIPEVGLDVMQTSSKVIYDGQVLIEHKGKMYNVQGQEVK